MQMKPINELSLAVGASLLAFAFPSLLNAQTLLELRKAGTAQVLHEVQLQSNAQVDLDPTGKLIASCLDANNDSTCDGIVTGGGVGAAPTISSLSVTATIPEGATRPRVEVGQTFYANWATANAEICVASGPTELAGWTGLQALSGTGNAPSGGLRFNVLPAAGNLPASIGLSCYGTGGRAQRSVQVDVVQPAGPVGCSVTSPYIAPAGWNNSGLTWQQVGGNATYPPNGATRSLALGAKSYISLPFTPQAGAKLEVALAEAQGTAVHQWEGMFIGISECAADFRFGQSSPPPSDPTLSSLCRRTVQAGAQNVPLFETSGAQNGRCQLTAGRTYYLNFIQVGSEFALGAGLSDCPSNQCQIQIKFQ